jgi:hypothetical protein
MKAKLRDNIGQWAGNRVPIARCNPASIERKDDMKLLDTYEVVRNGGEVKLDVTALGEDMVAALFAHGVAAKIGDAAASATAIVGEGHFGKPKKEVNKADWKAWQETDKAKKAIAEASASMMQAVIDNLVEGNWTARGTGIARATLSGPKAIAVKAAKADLLIAFKRITGKAKLVDIVDADEKVAAYFTLAGDTPAWENDKVLEWIGKQKDSGKRDYIAEAEASLELDLDDLDI